jgi:hypothetical protein
MASGNLADYFAPPVDAGLSDRRTAAMGVNDDAFTKK